MSTNAFNYEQPDLYNKFQLLLNDIMNSKWEDDEGKEGDKSRLK